MAQQWPHWPHPLRAGKGEESERGSLWERGGAYLDEPESVSGHPLGGAGGGGEESYQGLVHLTLVVRVSLRRAAEAVR